MSSADESIKSKKTDAELEESRTIISGTFSVNDSAPNSADIGTGDGGTNNRVGDTLRESRTGDTLREKSGGTGNGGKAEDVRPDRGNGDHQVGSNRRAAPAEQKRASGSYDSFKQEPVPASNLESPPSFWNRTDSLLLSRFKSSALAAEAIVLVIAAIEMIGWAFGIEALKHPIDEPGLQSPAAIDFFLISGSVLLLSIGTPRAWRVVLAKSIAVVVMIACAATYIEHTFQLYWPDIVIWKPEDSRGLTYPGPLLPHESVAFVLVALGALSFKVTLFKKDWIAQLLACLVFGPSLVVLCFYMLGQSHLCIYFGCVKLSPITCFIFLLTCYGLFFMQPETGVAKGFSLRSTAGMLLRRSAAAVLLVITLLMPRHILIAGGVFDEMTANVCTALAAILALAVFAWWSLPQVEKEEKKRQQALVEQGQLIEQNRQVIEQKDQVIQNLQSAPQSRVMPMKMVCLECAREFDNMTMTHCPDDNSLLKKIMDNLRPGSMIDGRYKILRELGSGGLSTVYLGRHELMKKDFAIKVLQIKYSSEAKMVQRFQREARAASSLSHPNLVAVHDFNIGDDGQAYMVMEFLEGSSLSDFLKQNGPIPWQKAVPLFLQICEGLNHAHANGVIHRDLKPGNVMLLPSDEESSLQPKIVDFGFAKVTEEAGQQLTHTGEVFGSPLYMSPEQCEGKRMDKRSDLYALGCIMYQCLAGRPPFQGDSIMSTLFKQMQEAPPAVPEQFAVPDWLENIIQKLLAKNAEDRYQNAVDVIVALNVGLATMK